MGITIHKAMHDDINNIVDGVLFCQKSDHTGQTLEEYLEYVFVDNEKNRKTLASLGDGECYCVMYEKKMIGFIIINKPGNEYFWAIFLIEWYWRKGYDTELLDFALNELKRSGREDISMWVLGSHCGVRALYERHGFSFDGTTREVGKIADRFGEFSLVLIRYVLKKL